MRPLNIFQVINTLEIAGAERHVQWLSEKLTQKGHKVIVAYSYGGEIATELKACGIETLLITPHRTHFKYGAILKLVFYAWKNKIDLIHAHLGSAAALSRKVGKIARIPVIATMHRDDPAKPFRGINRLIAVSEFAKSYLITQGFSADKITTIYNGIGLNKFDPKACSDELRTNLGFQGNNPIVGTIARLRPEKKLELFLQAIKQILGILPDVKFIIVGDGPTRQGLETLAQQLQISDNLLFAGYRKDIPQLLNLIDIFVLPSLKEGLPIALLEAMATAKPTVATAVGGIPEIVEHNKTGLVVPPGEPKALAEAIIYLLNHPQIATKMGAAGRKRAEEKFNLNEIVEKIERIYYHVLNKHKEN